MFTLHSRVMQKSCEGVTNHLDSSARTKVLRLLSWHFIVLEIVACRSSFLCACTHALHYKGIVFLYITKGSPLGDTLSLSCEASVGTSGSNN